MDIMYLIKTFTKILAALLLAIATASSNASANDAGQFFLLGTTNNYIPFNQCVSGNCVNGKGKMVFPNGDTYEGDFVNGKPEGQGTMAFKNGNHYTGQFVKGMMNGKGKFRYGIGSIYEGNFVNDKMDGQGTMTELDGSYFIGEYKGDWREGFGKEYNSSTKTLREGTWKNGTFSGTASTVSSPPTTSKRCVSGNCFNGFGKLITPGGDIYEGNFVNGPANGKGKATYANGDIYDGDWVNGTQEGLGTFTYKNGDVYTGQFAKGRFNGKGIIRTSDGNIYEGDFVNDQKMGFGTFRFKDGAVYIGQVSNNRINGKGKYTLPNGDIYEGNFVGGNREGQGTFTNKTGSYYAGEWKNDKQNGFGKDYNKATKVTREGTWKDGLLVTAAISTTTKPTVIKQPYSSSQLPVAETATQLRETLNGKYDYLDKEPLTYILINKKTNETRRYQIEFIDDGGKLGFRWKESTKKEQSEKLVITDTALASATKYVNFFSTKTAIAPDKEIAFILSQKLHKELKDRKEISLDLGSGVKRLTFHIQFTASSGTYTDKNVKVVHYHADDLTARVQILDDPICPLIVKIETAEYTLTLV